MRSKPSVQILGDAKDLERACERAAKTVTLTGEQIERKAQKTVAAGAREREALKQLASEYSRLADSAEKGSHEQVVAAQRAEQALRKLGDEHKRTSDRSDDMVRGALVGSGALTGLGRAAMYASGTFLGAAGLTEVMKSSVEVASNLNEQTSKTEKTFGASAAAIEQWSNTTARGIGIAKDKALEGASTFGAFLEPLGIAPAKAASMSRSMVQLAADMASFNNASPEDTLLALRSGLAGEAEPLRRFGVSLSQTRVEAEAMRLGIVKTTADMGKVEIATRSVDVAQAKLTETRKKYGEGTTQTAQAENALESAQQRLTKAMAGHTPQLTAQQKAMATYQIILDDTKLAQGDFARTSGGLANQQRILHAQWRDSEALLGKALMPAVLGVTKGINEWLGKSENQERIQRALNTAVSTGKTIIDDTWPVVKKLAERAGDVADAVGGWGNVFALITGATILGKVTKLAGGFTDLIGGAKGSSGIKGAESSVSGLGAAIGKLPALKKISIVVALDALFNPPDWAKRYSGSKGWGNLWHDILGAVGLGGSGGSPSPGGNPLDTSSGGLPGLALPGLNAPAAAAAASRPTPTSTSTSAGRQKLVDLAMSMLGKPYLWGGTGSGGFDCSGFVQWVFSQGGVSIPRTSQAQFNAGTAVSRQNLQPGDAVFTNMHGDGPHHVGLYVGNGQVIEAHGDQNDTLGHQRPGDVIKTISLADFGFAGARRYVSAAAAPAMSNGLGGLASALDLNLGLSGLHPTPPALHVGSGGSSGSSPLIPLAMANALKYATVMTPGEADDLRELEKQRKFLLEQLKRAGKSTQRYGDILDALAGVKSDIAATATLASSKKSALDPNLVPIAGGFGGVTLADAAALATWAADKFPHLGVRDANMLPIAGGFGSVGTSDRTSLADWAKQNFPPDAMGAGMGASWEVAGGFGTAPAAELKKMYAAQDAAIRAAAAKSKALAKEKAKELATAAADAVKGARGQFEQAWSFVADGGLKAFDARTQAHLRDLDAELQRQMDQIDRGLNDALKGIERDRAALTGSEKKLQDLQLAHEQKAQQDALDQARKAVADADALQRQDGESDADYAKRRADAKTAAQQQLDDALYAQQVASLQRDAQTERQAADEKAARDSQAAQDEVELKKRRTQEDFDRQKLDYDSERQLERAHFAARLIELEKFLETRGGSVKDANDAVKSLFEEFSVDPTFKQAGIDAGNGFAEGLAEALAALGIPLATVTGAVAAQSAGKGGPLAELASAQALAESLGMSRPDAKVWAHHAVGFAEGGDVMVTQPTLFVAGEGGQRERVKVTPWKGGRGAGEIVVHVDMGRSVHLSRAPDVAREIARTLAPELKRLIGA